MYDFARILFGFYQDFTREAMRSNNRMDRLEAQKNQQVRQNEASGSDGHRTEGPA